MAEKKHRCGTCALDLPVDAFTRDKTRKGGRASRCKSCDTARKSPDLRTTDLVAQVIAGGAALAAFGSPLERACAESLIAAGNFADAAIKMQLEPHVLRAYLSELKRKAAVRGYSPGHDMVKTVPEGFSVKGVSTLYAADGSVSAQWVKSKREDDHKYAALLDAMSHIADAWQSKAEPVKAPKQILDEDLLCVFPLGDPHLGSLCWPQETGGDKFDLAIAEQNLFTAVDHLVGIAPPAARALVINLGDFFHSDSKRGETTRGTPVDVDGRWPKVLATGVRVMRRLIDRALEKHGHVTVINEIGNHDDHSSIMLSIALGQFYEREPRVTIDTSPEPFHWFRFGKCMLGVHHGDKTKSANLPAVMACDRPEDWGATRHRYFYVGHIHHDTVKEYPGVTVESFRTLAARDAWHHGQGYRSGRDLKLDVLHREFGRINRHIIGIDQIVSKEKVG